MENAPEALRRKTPNLHERVELGRGSPDKRAEAQGVGGGKVGYDSIVANSFK